MCAKDEEFEDEIVETNYGTIILGLGIIIILAVVALKMAGPSELPVIGTYPSEIYTGDPYLSYHFFMGLITGIVVAGIGGAMSFRKKPVSEFEEDEFEEEFEEVLDEGICPTCGAVIPVTSQECPECGEELEPVEEEITGETTECPICAATVAASEDECPECGEPLGTTEEDLEEDFFDDL